MSSSYAAGVQATAIAAITAAVEARLSTDSAGRRVLNVASLIAWLEADFATLRLEAVAPADANTVDAAARSVNLSMLVGALNNAVRPERFASHPAWSQTTTTQLNGPAMAAAVKSAIAELKRAVDDVTRYYADLNRVLPDKIIEYYERENIDATIPQGVVRTLETRAYIQTFVTDRDEESAPGPASDLVTIDQNDTVTVTRAAVPSGRHIVSWRLYRANSNSSGAEYQFVAEVASGTSTYIDEKVGAELDEVCPTTTWEEPPSNLRGLISTACRSMAGFYDKTWCYSEGDAPYAWPPEYRHTSPWPIVGGASIDDLEIVLTTGKPMFIAGADAANKGRLDIESDQACVSRRSIVVGPGGVYFASPDGICRANRGGVALLTAELFDRDTWQALQPGTIFATICEGNYLFWANGGTVCYSLSLAPPFKLVTITRTASAVYQDLAADRAYVSTGTTIQELFSAGTKRTARWKGKKAEMPQLANMGWAQVVSDFEASLTAKVYRDGELTDTKTHAARAAKRLAAIRAKDYEVELTGTARATALVVASSAEELRQL